MTLSNKKKRRSRTGRTIKCYYSDHPEDTEEPKQFIERAILADKVKAHYHLIDIINILLLGIRENEYLSVRSLPREFLRNPERPVPA